MTTEAEEILAEMNQDSMPVEAWENVDLDLPGAYLDEIMAVKLVDVIHAYHLTEVERKSLRHQGQDAKAEEMGKQVGLLRDMAAFIQYTYPNTKTMYKQYATIRAKNSEKERLKAG